MATPPYVADGIIPPYCAIRIWRAGETEGYIDVTRLQLDGGFAVIQKAENRQGSATFTISNDISSPTLNMCSPSFAGWSDEESGAVRPGQYVEFFDVSEDSEPRLIFDGRITSMTPSVDSISFEVGDGITFLSKAGTWLRRNYRDIGGSVTRLLPIDLSTEPPSIDLSKQEGTPSFPVIRYKSFERSLTHTSNTVTIPRQQDGMTFTKLRYVNVTFGYDFRQDNSFSIEGHFKVMVDDKVAYTSDRRYNYASQRGTITVPVDMDFRGMIDLEEYPYSVVFERTGGTSSIARDLRITIQSLGAISDTEELITTSSSVITFGDLSDLDAQYPDNRLSVLFEQGRQLTTDIMSNIADAIGYGSRISVDAPNAVLPIYRVGGSYAQTYIQKLADIADENGRRCSYTVEGISSVLKVGRRYSVDDDAVFSVNYAGDSLEGILISDFKPKRTLKNRPNLVTLKANISGDVNSTVIVTFEDTESTEARGCTIESLMADSSANSLLTIGQSAFNELLGITLDQWEGELTIPDIAYGMMGEGDDAHAGSGAVISLTDSRFGILGEKVKVCQIVYDYNTCVSKLTINNFDMQYSSAISSTNALAVQISDMVGGISDTTLYNQQYAYVKVLDRVWTPPTSVQVTLKASRTPAFQKTEDTQCIYALPNGTAVVIASFDSEDGIYLPNEDPYGIDTILLGGMSEAITIPLERRPDFLAGQSLVLCLVLKTSQ